MIADAIALIDGAGLALDLERGVRNRELSRESLFHACRDYLCLLE